MSSRGTLVAQGRVLRDGEAACNLLQDHMRHRKITVETLRGSPPRIQASARDIYRIYLQDPLNDLIDAHVVDIETWTFGKNRSGQWLWARHSANGETVAAAHAGFDVLEDCIADAETYGYARAPWPAL